MTRRASLPMYRVPDGALAAFWRGLRTHLRTQGFADTPERLEAPVDLLGHWLAPDLLFSQTCGYPLVTSLAGRVRYVATPCYRAEGCQGPLYSSALVVRAEDDARSLADLRSRRAAINGRDSQSGSNTLRAAVAPLAHGGRFFSDVIETGAHRASLEAVRQNRADIASIDAVTLALARRDEPELVQGLRVLVFTDPAPGLPFVTALSTGPEDVARLRAALAAACADPDFVPARNAMLLEGVEVLPAEAYARITEQQERAVRLGYPELA